jgi:hypothetical protein
MALKGVTSGVLGAVPFIGSHLADYINSKYAVGGDVAVGEKPDVPPGTKMKEIKTPAQLKKLIQDYPEEAKKAGLTVEKVDAEVKQAKEQMKAIGGMVGNRQSKMKEVQPVKGAAVVARGSEKKMAHGGKLSKDILCDSKVKVDSANDMAQRPKMAVGGEPKEPKAKKARSQAQLDATKRLVEANRKRHAKK